MCKEGLFISFNCTDLFSVIWIIPQFPHGLGGVRSTQEFGRQLHVTNVRWFKPRKWSDPTEQGCDHTFVTCIEAKQRWKTKHMESHVTRNTYTGRRTWLKRVSSSLMPLWSPLIQDGWRWKVYPPRTAPEEAAPEDCGRRKQHLCIAYATLIHAAALFYTD